VTFFLGLSSSSIQSAPYRRAQPDLVFLPRCVILRKLAGDSDVIFGSALFLTRMPRPDRTEFDRMG
jgi:hypothetical protein